MSTQARRKQKKQKKSKALRRAARRQAFKEIYDEASGKKRDKMLRRFLRVVGPPGHKKTRY